MQLPGPTLIVHENDTVTINLANKLPAAAGNTSILFPGFTLTSACPAGQQGLLACEAAPGGTVTYTFTASTPGTRAYYSGTQGDLQVEMGLYGAIIVLPNSTPTGCTALGSLPSRYVAPATLPKPIFAWQHPPTTIPGAATTGNTCFSSRDGSEHSYPGRSAGEGRGCAAIGSAQPVTCKLAVPTEPYHPAYFMINGRSMPDDMDPNYAVQYPHQPYNGDPLCIPAAGSAAHYRPGTLAASLPRARQPRPHSWARWEPYPQLYDCWRSDLAGHCSSPPQHTGPRDGRNLLLDG